MKPDAVFCALGVEESAAVLGVDWECSQASQPSQGLPFLQEEFVRKACDVACLSAGIAEETVRAAQRLARRVNEDAAVRALTWHMHCCLHRSAGYPVADPAVMRQWPTREKLLALFGDDCGLFVLLMLLSGADQTDRLYRGHGIPDSIRNDTFDLLRRNLEEHHREHSQYGLPFPRVRWFIKHLRGEIFRLGRLEFQFACCPRHFNVFRHGAKRTVVALAEDGARYLPDGQLDGPGRTGDVSGGWTARLVSGDKEIRGFPIHPEGYALHREVTLSTAEWAPVLVPGDPVLAIHIPANRPLDFDACAASLRSAATFFPHHFPRRPFMAWTLECWILDTQLRDWLSPDSNMVRFQNEVYLVPYLRADTHLAGRVFGCMPDDWSKAPRDTSLQRALVDHVLRGKLLHAQGGACFLFPEDFDWGAQVYRKQGLAI